jgi:hypothetical protein
MDGPGKKGSPGAGKSAKRWDYLVKEPSQETLKGVFALRPEKGFDACEVGGKVFSKNRPPSPHYS